MRVIEGNLKKIKGQKSTMPFFCVGAGRAHEALRTEFMEQLHTLQEKCHFRYLRFHGIFLDDMDVYREKEDGSPVYNWQYVDEVYDRLLEAGIRPFVELSFMPSALASGDQLLCWWKGNVTEPKDYVKWYHLVREFISHLTERYGHEEIQKWFFEVWNEPNHPSFFAGNQESYFHLYEESVRAIKEIDAAYQVGGPATAGNEWVTELIDFCTEHKLPLDFISTHDYGNLSRFDEFGERLQYMQKDPKHIVKRTRQLCDQVKVSSQPNLPIYYTEWSSSASSRDNVHDSYIQAPYILYNLKRLEGAANAMSYWTFTDVFEEAGPAPTPFHGGFGLINQQGIRKPAFYAYEYLAKLGETELENSDSDSYICRSGSNVQVLLWNYTHIQSDLPNQRYYSQDIIPQTQEKVQVILKGIEKGQYAVKYYRIGYRVNDAYADYFDLGKPVTLNREAVKAIQEHNNGQPEQMEFRFLDDSFEKELVLRENEVYFMELTKI